MNGSEELPWKQELEKLKLQAEIGKLQAEKMKIEAEESQFRKPWFRQTSFLNLLVTVLLPVITVALGYFFGGGKEFFDAQRINLENKKHDLQDQIAADSANRSQLVHQNDSLKTEYSFLGRSVKDLTATKNGLEKDNRKLQALVAEERERLFISPILSHINTLIEDNKKGVVPVNPYHPSSKQLVKLLSSHDPRAISVVKSAAAKNDTDDVISCILHYILFKSTNDKLWFDELVRLAHNRGNQGSAGFWSIFGTGDWGNNLANLLEDFIKLTKEAGLSRPIQAQVFLALSYHPLTKTDFSDPSFFFDGIELARDFALDESVENGLRTRGVSALSSLEPRACLITVATLLASSHADITFRAAIWNRVNTPGMGLDSAMIELAFPRTIEQDWNKWIDGHKNLVDVWLEKGLAHARRL